MITKEKVSAFRSDFNKAVEGLEKKYNVKIEMKSIAYTNIDFHFKVECTEKGENGAKKVDETHFNVVKTWLGFDGNYGDTYTSSGKTYTVVGLNAKRPKYAVELSCSDGKNYKSTVQNVNMMLKLYGKSSLLTK